LTLDDLAGAFSEAGLPFTQDMRGDLARDQATNAATLLHEYEVEA
jgi:hypothetical protein